MKSLRFMLSIVLVSLSTVAFAQSTHGEVRGAEVLRNHENPGGRVGRPRHRPGDAGDVRRQADARSRCA